MSQQIKLTDIRYAGTNARVELDWSAVDDYAQRCKDDSPFPPIDVYHELAADGRDIYWLGDGWHRITAAGQLDHETIAAEVLKGGKRDALEHSLKSNWHHGVKRTSADKKRAVELVLADDVWKEWSARQIAALCGVSHTFVVEIMAATVNGTSSETPPAKRVGADGKSRPSPRGRAKKADATPTPSNGKPVSFDVPAIEAATAKKRPGKQKRDPKVRKEALKAYGVLVRLLDKLGITPDVEAQMRDILTALKS